MKCLATRDADALGLSAVSRRDGWPGETARRIISKISEAFVLKKIVWSSARNIQRFRSLQVAATLAMHATIKS